MFNRSAGWAHRVTNDKTYPFSKESLSRIEPLLPPLIWTNREELDDLVMGILGLELLKGRGPITGAQIAMLCGAGKSTIRASIKRLRDAGENIGASMVPPRGYRLEDK